MIFRFWRGVTEIRPGTYIFMDASQANAYGSLDRNAATVLTTIISRPTAERVITDVVQRELQHDQKQRGFVPHTGLGLIKGWPDVEIFDVYDEHAIIYNQQFRDHVKVGDKG